MSTSTTAPILPATLAAPVPPVVHDSGADTAPGVIVIDSCTALGGTLVVRLAGEIDHYSAAPLWALLASAADDGYTGLVLDTARVTFCDSGLLAVLRWWPRHGRRLRLANRSRAVQRLLNASAAAGQQQPRAGSPTTAVTS
ncbi:STAS domain-containing protein [Streptomyces sp. TLI_105]|uniref:STAS domain-containing protein n=1 Tax=Streptomyces sp. TLI_105 TaxID=1881019 RepID=UPI0008984FC8|nr:STAS domain-containing protein [Streptomyces sp. TLI_105]SED03830.1 anti-anti-sigma factor [Streptomyces sp. TLI_105]